MCLWSGTSPSSARCDRSFETQRRLLSNEDFVLQSTRRRSSVHSFAKAVVIGKSDEHKNEGLSDRWCSFISQDSKKCWINASNHEINKKKKKKQTELLQLISWDLVIDHEDQTRDADDQTHRDRGKTSWATKFVIIHARLFSTDRSFVIIGHLRNIQDFLESTEEGGGLGQWWKIHRLNWSFGHFYKHLASRLNERKMCLGLPLQIALNWPHRRLLS